MTANPTQRGGDIAQSTSYSRSSILTTTRHTSAHGDARTDERLPVDAAPAPSDDADSACLLLTATQTIGGWIAASRSSSPRIAGGREEWTR
jgi:hypothetical protein